LLLRSDITLSLLQIKRTAPVKYKSQSFKIDSNGDSNFRHKKTRQWRVFEAMFLFKTLTPRRRHRGYFLITGW
jgi:hypothetical protein